VQHLAVHLNRPMLREVKTALSRYGLGVRVGRMTHQRTESG
jgi:hypothetical protein